MENCLYMKQRICSIEVLNEFDIKLHTMINEWRKAGDNNELICEDCGQQVILRAGDVRIPHFAHKPGTKVLCSYDERDSEDHRRAKKIFYQYFRRYYPVVLLDLNHKLPNGQRCDLFVTFPSNVNLIIEYIGQGINSKEFRLKKSYYTSLGYTVIWFLGAKALVEKSSKGFITEIMLNEETRIAHILDVQNETILFMRLMEYSEAKAGVIKYQEPYQEKYPLSSIKIEPSGKILSPFDAEYEKAYTVFIEKCSEAEAKQEEKRRLHEERLKAGWKAIDYHSLEKQKRDRENYERRQQKRQSFPTEKVATSISPLKKKRDEWLNRINVADLNECERILDQCRTGLLNVQNRKKRVPHHEDYYSIWLKKCMNMFELAKKDGERANFAELKRRLYDPLADLL
ncbi:MAG: hypothetical protein APF81_17405 [Desulfosporosinus sp. BRH_c37]|nr:MAG: hypothetical protein APF81_17405 [Desulfosporosinus sp. BRH_c37]